ncbi:MAG: hypothetical protein ACTSR3_05770 [Candidatus Helarchaeota archaeon]
MEQQEIKTELEKALSFEDEWSKFKALGEVAELTKSCDLPQGIKERILKRIDEHQLSIAGLLD